MTNVIRLTNEQGDQRPVLARVYVVRDEADESRAIEHYTSRHDRVPERVFVWRGMMYVEEKMSDMKYVLTEINDPHKTQSDVAKFYSTLIGKKYDFEMINLAIKLRWSKSGLNRVKRMAWKLLNIGG